MPPQQDGTSTHSHHWGIPTPTELLVLSTVGNSSDNKDIYLWCKGPQGVKERGRSSKPVPAGSVEGAQGWVVQVSKEPQSLGQNPWPCIPQEQHPSGRRAGCPAWPPLGSAGSCRGVTLNRMSVHIAFPWVIMGSWSSPLPSQQSSSTHLSTQGKET